MICTVYTYTCADMPANDVSINSDKSNSRSWVEAAKIVSIIFHNNAFSPNTKLFRHRVLTENVYIQNMWAVKHKLTCGNCTFQCQPFTLAVTCLQFNFVLVP